MQFLVYTIVRKTKLSTFKNMISIKAGIFFCRYKNNVKKFNSVTIFTFFVEEERKQFKSSGEIESRPFTLFTMRSLSSGLLES